VIEDYRFTQSVPAEAILPVALKYNILTEYTRCALLFSFFPRRLGLMSILYDSFLAIDQRVRFNRTDIDVVQVDQPIPLPEGLDSSFVTPTSMTEGSTALPSYYHPSGSGANATVPTALAFAFALLSLFFAIDIF